ncbi:MAG: hypothetical protein FWB87_16465 [Defluviitaleaceae bacterium]|nr:hypothetical protein [Defluviitaleaceae bacterium]MCL2264363.1 hypothetical protein [Defluviitaleaceae bacterium]
MGINKTVQRTGYFNELSPDDRNNYLGIKEKKFMHTEDNIYYSVFIKGDGLDSTMQKLQPLLDELCDLKEKAQELKQPMPFKYGLQVMPIAIRTYTLRLSEPDLYDIFFIPSDLPNIETNRIQIQLRAEGLWTRKNRATLKKAYIVAEALLAEYGLEIARTQENRIDFCYHTNIKPSVDKIFERDGDARYIKARLGNGRAEFNLIKTGKGTNLDFYYYTFGSPKSNNWSIKFYDKVKEVIEVGYKSFFFMMWYEGGLISLYDKWCYEYAFMHKNTRYLGKARLAFYKEYGTNPCRIKKYTEALDNINMTLEEYTQLANEFMPLNTPVINIEFQTMREFYRRSDEFINKLQTQTKDYPPKLKRLYQVLDNRDIFLQYLHGEGFAFVKGENEDGTPNYLSWWERLRNTKVGGIKADEKLLRDYAYNMDKNLVVKQGLQKVITFAVHEDRMDTDLYDDCRHWLEYLTDNQIYEMDKQFRQYKVKQERRIKNRKKRREAAKHGNA